MNNEDFADGIYWILKAIDQRLGGGFDSGSGIDYHNDVFETSNFWDHSDDCTCGAESAESEFDDYFEGQYGKWDYSIPDEELSQRYRDYSREQLNFFQGEAPGHADNCSLMAPGFLHYASGLRVDWYKRVGRSTESNMKMKALDWFKIVVECIESVRDDTREHKDD